jgi:hypothetical protein
MVSMYKIKANGEKSLQLHSFFILAPCGGEWTVLFPCHLISGKRAPSTHECETVLAPKSGWTFTEYKLHCPYLKSSHDSSVVQIIAQSPHRLHYL